ncbi:testis-expressed protein 36-like [Watersipora subatra]|uniref:testis-expressed protein 36-like n=1 Tax=Watersipora subatra TaxID=2589382 RepID=UPI00355C4A13
MPKGRGSNPSTENVGSWYCHNTCKDYLNVGSRLSSTSTGSMLDTKKESKRLQPDSSSHTFDYKSKTLYDQENPFSYHDNKNDIQLTGEYFGNGKNTRHLGRKIADDKTNQHRSEISSFLKHRGREVTDSFFHSNYMLSHEAKVTELPSHKRFPKRYDQAYSGPTVITTFTEPLPVTSIASQTLVSSIEPHAKHNSWKYTYHRHKKSDIYPKVWGDRCSVHLPDNKPRKRPMIVSQIKRECTTCA